jgi:riboflavin kinase/FMN adenylyltransferase
MIVVRSIDDIPAGLPLTVATIGNFDGVHLGHQEIFRRVMATAAALNGTSVVITFEPHPLTVVPSTRQISLITTTTEKEALIAAAGIDCLVIIPFTREFARRSAREFVVEVLVERLEVRTIIIGYDYAFGRNREGGTDLLSELGREYGFAVEVLPPIGDSGHIFSSSEIRRMVREGEVNRVVPLLGRHFSLGGRVVHGHGRGKVLGFPTANVVSDHELIPADGVYAVKVLIAATLFDGACNIGTKPTFGEEARTIEVFLFNFDDVLYGRELRIFFIERLRGETAYPDSEALRCAIASDVNRCREILSTTTLRDGIRDREAT